MTHGHYVLLMVDTKKIHTSNFARQQFIGDLRHLRHTFAERLQITLLVMERGCMRTTLACLFIFTLLLLPKLDAHAQTNTELEFLAIINEYRSLSEACWSGRDLIPWPSGSSKQLALSPALSVAAKQHNYAMIQTNCTLHTCPGELPLRQRVVVAGYPSNFGFMSENIAGGFETAVDVFDVWRQSQGHHLNMLNCWSHAIGISMVYEPNSLAWWYWTTDFSDIIDSGTPAPDPAPSPKNNGPKPLMEALDIDDNQIIGDKEIMNAISYWVSGTQVPGADQTIEDGVIDDLIDLWVMGEPIS